MNEIKEDSKKLDKRTKAYRDNIKLQKTTIVTEGNIAPALSDPTTKLVPIKLVPEGLGDTIEKITTATGIKKVVEWLADGKDCGCQERKKWLNKKYQYKVECMVKSEYEWFKKYLERHNPKKFLDKDIYHVVQIHFRLFKVIPKVCRGCDSAILVMNKTVGNIKQVYDSYTDLVEVK